MDEAWHRILRIEDLEALSPISLCGPKGAASQCSRSDCLCYHWYSLKQTHATCSCRMNYIFPKLVYWCLSLNLVHLGVFTKYLPFWKLLGKTRYLKAAHPLAVSVSDDNVALQRTRVCRISAPCQRLTDQCEGHKEIQETPHSHSADLVADY